MANVCVDVHDRFNDSQSRWVLRTERHTLYTNYHIPCNCRNVYDRNILWIFTPKDDRASLELERLQLLDRLAEIGETLEDKKDE